MKPVVSSLPALKNSLPTRTDHALLQQIANQVHRDCFFEKPGEYGNIEEQVAFVAASITPVYLRSRHRFMQIMYKVDLSEKMLSPVLANARDTEDAMLQTAVMIIYRCFQKVMTRDYFR